MKNIKKNIVSLLDKASEKQLRTIYLVIYEIVKRSTAQ